MDGTNLTEAQRDGLACVRCGRDDQAMVPVGRVDGVQVFGCTSHEAIPRQVA